MLKIRTNDQIFDVEGGWFRARWHYSFDMYQDPEYTSFGTMRVFNDDRLIPGAVWPMHPHRDIEGLTYVVEGQFRHEDNVGGSPGPLPAGSVQRMTLGSGAYHSEQNASETQPMRFIQSWIMPAEHGLTPSVEQRVFTIEDRTDTLLKAISGDGGDAERASPRPRRNQVNHRARGGSVRDRFPDQLGDVEYEIGLRLRRIGRRPYLAHTHADGVAEMEDGAHDLPTPGRVDASVPVPLEHDARSVLGLDHSTNVGPNGSRGTHAVSGDAQVSLGSTQISPATSWASARSWPATRTATASAPGMRSTTSTGAPMVRP